MPPTMVHAGLTDIGRVRETNEDAFVVDDEAGLIVVADGLGGHRAGAVASTFVVEHLPRQLAIGRVAGMEDSQGAEQLLRQSILMISEQMHEKGHAVPEYRGMGATVVAGLFANSTALIAHLGDSRAYLHRDGVLAQVTHDHNLGNTLRANGVILTDAEDTPEYHALRRFMGMANPLPPDIAAMELREGDRFLMCSDGLTNMLSDTEIADILLRGTSCEETCSQLVTRANQAGGTDNITVIVTDVQSTGSDVEACVEVKEKMSEMDIDELPSTEVPIQRMVGSRVTRG